MDSTLTTLVLTVVGSVLASSGFWAYLAAKNDNKSSEKMLLIGLAHDRILSLALDYIDRGSITSEEYENLYEYLYIPYESVGGNGSATRIMKEVNELPLKKVNY